MGCERGQGTVEWVALTLVVSLAMLGAVVAGVRVPGVALARGVVDRIVCAAALADSCGDEAGLIAAYGTEVGKLVRGHVPTLIYESGSRAVPVDFRRCRSSECGDGPGDGLVHRTDAGLPVTAFVHVIDCREQAAEQALAAGADCSAERAGNLYVQLWLYYADSATLRGMPVAGGKGYHADDWESVQLRFGPGGEVEERASSHHGFNHGRGLDNWASDSSVHPHDGWGPETRLLFVSGGSHAGSALEPGDWSERLTPGRRVHLIPLEPIAAASSARFAISPPWLKRVWFDPEYDETD